MNTVTLTPEEKALLTDIVNDKFSAGAFSGMIFNASLERTTFSVEELTKRALATRLKLKEMTK